MKFTAEARGEGQGAKRFSVLAHILIVVSFISCLAPLTAMAVRVDDYPVLRQFMAEMESKYEFDPIEMTGWFEQVEIREDIIEAIRRPRENLPWHEYRKSFVNDDRMRRGVEFWKAHAEVLARAETQFGVPPEIVAAIIGVETRYGHQAGRYRILDALATLTLRYPERSDFFRKEMGEYLLLSRELGVNPLSLRGSYAGAMGAPQFISSSYRRYAVDFNGDKKRDLIASIDDAIGSVANYLKQNGWRQGEPIIGEVKLDGGLYTTLENPNLQPRLTLKQLSQYGILPVEPLDGRKLATLITLEGEDGPVYRLGYTNFYVITRYNRSTNYSMAVVELSRALRERFDTQ